LRTALLERLGDLHRRLGLSTCFVTHDPQEVRAISDQTLRLERGQLVR
jgi:ABC-type sulfate/molybdate transport systems ATPase subunit